MVAQLYRLGTQEPASLDVARLAVLRQALGEKRCREVVEEVVFHLTDRLAQLKTALETGDAVEMQVLASRLASLSEQVGLGDFARVARDLGSCAAAGDTYAIGAVGARLQRLGEDSLFTVILYADQSAR